MDPEPAEIREGETRVCSNCKQDINVTAYILHELHCKKHNVLCEICGEPVRRTELEAHYQEEHAPIACELCQEEVPREDMETHLEDICPEKRVLCQYCELDIRRADFEEHVEGCGSRTDVCELCNRRVMLRDMADHKLDNCGVVKAKKPPQDDYSAGQWDGWEGDGADTSVPGHFGAGWEDNYGPNMLVARRIALGPDGTPRVQALIMSPLMPGLVPTGPPAIDHTHYPRTTATKPTRSESNGHSSEQDNIHVDPQWLASVADVCGEENLDQVLAQNMMAEDYRRSSPPLVCPHHHHHHAVIRPVGGGGGGGWLAATDPGAGADQYSNLSSNLGDFEHTFESEYPPKRPANDSSRNGAAEDARKKEREAEQERKDAELARQIYDRDLEQARKETERSYYSNEGGFSGTGGGYQGTNSYADSYPGPEEDYPNTTAYAGTSGYQDDYPGTSNGYPGTSDGYPGTSDGYPGTSDGYPGTSDGYPGTSDGYPGTSDGYPGTSDGYPGTSDGYPGGGDWRREDMARERTGGDAELARKFQQSEGEAVTHDVSESSGLTSRYFHDGAHARNANKNSNASRNAEQVRRDERMARELQHGDINTAHKTTERADNDTDSRMQGTVSGVATEPFQDHRGYAATAAHTEDSDAELARRLQESDLDSHYKRIAAKSGQAHHGYGTAAHTGDSDEEIARRLQDDDSTLHYNPTSTSHRDRLLEPHPMHDSDAQLARAIHMNEHAYVESVERDKVLAQQMQQEEDQRVYGKGGPTDAGPYSKPPVELYNPNPVPDQEVERDNVMTDSMLARKLMMEDDDDDTTSYPSKGGYVGALGSKGPSARDMEEPGDGDMIPCEYCKSLFPLDVISNHQDICDAAYPRSDYTRAPLVHSKDPPAPKPLPQQVEEPQDNDVIPCEYCKSVFPLDVIEGHQQICDMSVGPSTFLYDSSTTTKSRPHRSEPSWGQERASYGSTSSSASRRGELVGLASVVPDRSKELPSLSLASRERYNSGRITVPSPEVSSDEEEQFLTANESFASGGRVGVGNGSTSGMGYLHNMNQSSGPCEVCGKLLPIKDLLKHETKCAVRHQKKETGTVPVVETSHPSKKPSKPKASANSSKKLAIRFPGQHHHQYAYPVAAEKQTSSTSTVTHSPTAQVTKTRHSPAQTTGQSSRKRTTGYPVTKSGESVKKDFTRKQAPTSAFAAHADQKSRSKPSRDPDLSVDGHGVQIGQQPRSSKPSSSKPSEERRAYNKSSSQSKRYPYTVQDRSEQ